MGLTEASVHLHCDCSRGLSANSLLAGVLGACDAMFGAEQALIVKLNEYMVSVFGLDSVSIRFDLEQDSNQHVFMESFEEGEIRDYEALRQSIRNNPAVKGKVKDAVMTMIDTPNVEFVTALFAIIGTTWAMEQLCVQSISVSPIPCSANIPSENMALLVGLPITSSLEGPLVTREGILILHCLTRLCDFKTANQSFPAMILRSVSYGRDNANNQVQTSVLLGTLDPVVDHRWNTDRMSVIEANIDDCTPEHLAFCVERLFTAGAVDAWLSPIMMKKGRAAHTIHCLVHHRQQDDLLTEIFRHSTTLGVRIQEVDRISLNRKVITIETPWTDTDRNGLVDVKIGYLGNEIVSVKAEFDHCRAIALEKGVPITSIATVATKKARDTVLGLGSM